MPRLLSPQSQAIPRRVGGLHVFEQIQVFTVSGNFTVPVGVTSVYATVVGGGGGGCTDANTRGGGGSGAMVYRRLVPVTPGQVISVTIGAGGATGSPNGSNGGSSSFGSLITAPGGLAATTSAGGAGGSSSSEDLWLRGVTARTPRATEADSLLLSREHSWGMLYNGLQGGSAEVAADGTNAWGAPSPLYANSSTRTTYAGTGSIPGWGAPYGGGGHSLRSSVGPAAATAGRDGIVIVEW